MRWRHALLAVVACFISAPLHADPIAEFYKGRNISIVVATSSGGAYDILARVLSRHIGRHIPGAPAATVRNMPGAGGTVGTNWLYNLAEKDGTVIGALLNIGPFEQVFGNPSRSSGRAPFARDPTIASVAHGMSGLGSRSTRPTRSRTRSVPDHRKHANLAATARQEEAP